MLCGRQDPGDKRINSKGCLLLDVTETKLKAEVQNQETAEKTQSVGAWTTKHELKKTETTEWQNKTGSHENTYTEGTGKAKKNKYKPNHQNQNDNKRQTLIEACLLNYKQKPRNFRT